MAAATGDGEGGRAQAVLWGLIALAVALRAGAALYFGNAVTTKPGVADQVSYHALALRLLGGHGFSFDTGWWPATPANEPTAHWSFLYTIFLSGVYGVAGVAPLAARLVQAVAVGILQPLLTYRIAARVFGDRVAMAAAAIVAVYAYFVYYAGALMTESFCIAALLWSLDAAARLGSRRGRGERPATRTWLELGVALSAAILLRQVVLVVAPVIVGWAAWRAAVSAGADGVAGRRRVAAGLAVSLLAIACAILPWTIRNRLAFGEFVLLNTNAGFAFFWGNHPVHRDRFIPILPGDGSAYGELIPEDLRGLNEAALDRALLRRGLGFVVETPGRYLRLSLGRAVEYAKCWPTEESGRLSSWARASSAGLLLPLALAGLLLAPSHRRQAAGANGLSRGSAAWLLLAVAACYTLVHVLTWALVRYRLPVDAMLVPFAALAVVRGYDAVVRRWRGAGVLEAHR